MIVGVQRESYPGERRVALVPTHLPRLGKAGLEVCVEAGAGDGAGFPDATYESSGARIVPDRRALCSEADLLLAVHGPGASADRRAEELGLLRREQVVVGLLNPLGAPENGQALAERGVIGFALELLPRISRAQPMDALSSMATVAGYKAVLLAAAELGKMFPMMITAAGTITPARVFVIGAGVAGLQAIAVSHRLGAVVHAYDVRPAVKEQVESLGAKFVEMALETQAAEDASGYAKAMGEEFYQRQRELMGRAVADSDVVITTAAVPGKRAPVLITREMVLSMAPGSVVVDLAAEGGGNCELTRAGETVQLDGVTILGPVNLPATVPNHASQMYSSNVTAFVSNLIKDGRVDLDGDDPIVNDTLLTREGKVVSTRVRELLASEERRSS
ncbi:MAG TPA: Re/Si-specific NAD(P)(+) transhydrogenase subunit alpha [Vicinamibacteria bacterium]|nr:Re/Si-specific NAD(P)(+) transhydrogenase subunit alpha [Vicinamibacteria bacterium]